MCAGGSVPIFDMERLNVKNISVMKPTLRNYIGTREDFEFYANSALGLVKDKKKN